MPKSWLFPFGSAGAGCVFHALPVQCRISGWLFPPVPVPVPTAHVPAGVVTTP